MNVKKIRDNAVITILIVLFLVFGILAVGFTKPLNAPDEEGHYDYAALLADRGSLPLMWVTTEAHQPPLYYFTVQPLFLATKGMEMVDRLYVLRYYSLLLGVGTILLVYLFVRKLFPEKPFIKWGTVAFVALNPQFIFMNSVVNNDSLGNFFGAAIIAALTFTLLRERIHWKYVLVNSAIILGAFLTKLALWPIALILLSVTLWKARLKLLPAVALFSVPLIIAAQWWIGRNIDLYGELTPMNHLRGLWYDDQHRDFLSPSGLWNWLATLYESYWARFGWFTLIVPGFYYLLLKVGALLAAIGLPIALKRAWSLYEKRKKQVLMALAGVAFIVIAGTFWANLSFYQPQGRYLFLVIGILSLAAAFGLKAMIPKRFRYFAFGAIIAFLLVMDIHSLIVLYWHG